MGSDDDIAASLPRPPLPAPARREAAIEEAMRRFDGGGDLPPAPAGGRRPQEPAPWWTPLRRPYASAFVSAALVALVVLPMAWLSMREQPTVDGGSPRAPVAREATPGRPAFDAADVEQSPAAPLPTLARNDAAPPSGGRSPNAQIAKEAAPPPAPTELAEAIPAQTPPRPMVGRVTAMHQAERSRREDRPDELAALESRDMVVTGARRAPAAAAPAISDEESDASSIIVTGTRVSSAKSAGRGDWNACTVDDPSRSLTRCRKAVDPAAKGAAGQAAAHVADGLSLAWEGEYDGAIKAFDRAIEIAPHSSFAYLNRGLAYRRNGALDRAIADLDLAVRYAPGAARAYYNRSIVQRQRGDLRRARADEERAVELDPRYADLLK